MNFKINISPIILVLLFVGVLSIGYLAGCQFNQPAVQYPLGVILDDGPGLENIQAVTDEFLEAWNQGDADGSSNTYAEDAVFMPPGQKSVIGRDAIRKFFHEQRESTDGADMNIEEQVKEVIYFDDWAVMRGLGEITIKESDSSESKFTFKWAMLSKRNQQGKWESVWDIYNDDNL
jgi:uncharacterized protein (TIGR02246 family)